MYTRSFRGRMQMNNRKLSLGLLIALVGFPQISETIYTPALPSVASSLQASAQLVEASLAIYFAGFAAGVSLWGAVSDWCGRRIAMLAGLLLYLFATFSCGNAASIETLLAWRFVQALGASVGSVITQTILRDAYEGVQRAKLFSVMSGALAFSPAIGPVLGGFISEYEGWRGNFWFLTCMAACLIVWTFLSLPETRAKHIVRPSLGQIYDLMGKMFSSKALWGHILLIGSTNGILFSFYQEAPFVFIEQLGMHPSRYGFFGMLIAAATLLSARLSYRLVTIYSAEAMIRCGALVALGGCLLFSTYAACRLISLEWMNLAAVTLALLIIFIGIGLIIPNSLSLALKPYQTGIGTAGSIFGGLYYGVVAADTWLMSFLHNGTLYALPYYLTALGCVLFLSSKMIAQPAVNAGKA